MNWHLLRSDEVIELMDSSRQGLSSQVVEEKRAAVGLNQLEEKKKLPPWMLFLNQFRDFMVLILFAAAVISGIVGDLTDAIVILVIVLLNTIIGFIQEYRAEKAMEALKKLATPNTLVIREGQILQISSPELVPGDMVLLEAGNIVPADLRLIETHALRIEESSLTGESVPVDKLNAPLKEKELPLGDRLNMAYKGTLVANGRGTGIVVATGMGTEIGQIARMLQEKEGQTPLQQRMADFGKKLSYLIISICIVLFVVGLLRGEEPVNMLLIAISLAVAAIPEALPALTTISLARGAKRLAEKNALIRKLPAAETLGSVIFICSDKTGTLTQNKMKVVEMMPYSLSGNMTINGELPLVEAAMAVNHEVQQTPAEEWVGDPTEIAIVEYVSGKHSRKILKKMREELPRVAELPFDSDRKCMTTIHEYGNGYIAFSKGAVEAIAARLEQPEISEKILLEAGELASQGIRVLAYGYRLLPELPEPFSYSEIENDLQFLGLVGMMDPPREEVKKAIQECLTAGIRPVMITGDHPETATAIAREIGILGKDDLVVTGPELNALTPEELEDKVERIGVYARVSPEQKLKIVKALQARGHFVAMTGDGVNDAPSLKASNIGIAMGITGTDVSKEAAHMILLDDNFATIVNAVREGRRIYDNIRKFVRYIMTCNSAEILSIFMAPLLGLPIPLLPIHILWINLVTDGLPGLALASEKEEKDIMQKPPRKAGESLFSGGLGLQIVWGGILMAFITLLTQAFAIKMESQHWQTMVFTVLSLAQLGQVFAIRSEHEFIYNKGFFSNLPLVGAVALTFVLQLAAIYLPFANEVLKTQPLSITELLICIGLAAVVFHTVELEKWIRKRAARRQSVQDPVL